MELPIGPDDAAAIRKLLAEIGAEPAASPSIRSAARSWSEGFHRDMSLRGLRTVAGLLGEASADLGMSPSCRAPAEYWCAFLSGRLRSIL